MKILIFTNHFLPENFKVNDVAFNLAERGHQVTVVTGIPNYPNGFFHEGYGIFKRSREVVNDVKVIRLPLVPRGSGSSVRLFINYLSYLVTSSLYSLYLALFKRFDAILVHETSPVTIGVPAVIYKLIRRIPLFFWVLDLWPESVKAAGNINNQYVLRFLEVIVKWIYHNSDYILISSNGFRKSITQKGNFDNKIFYFPNWAEDIFFGYLETYPPSNINFSFPSGFKIMYAGNLGEAQDFDNILATANLLRDENVFWIFLGGGRKEESIKDYAIKHGLQDKIILGGNYPVEAMPYFFSRADALLVSLRDEEIFNITVPAKLQAYLASGRPIVGILQGEGADILENSKAGYVCQQKNPHELARVIRELTNMSDDERKTLGANGIYFYNTNFNKKKNLDLLNKFFLQTVSNANLK